MLHGRPAGTSNLSVQSLSLIFDMLCMMYSMSIISSFFITIMLMLMMMMMIMVMIDHDQTSYMNPTKKYQQLGVLPLATSINCHERMRHSILWSLNSSIATDWQCQSCFCCFLQLLLQRTSQQHKSILDTVETLCTFCMYTSSVYIDRGKQQKSYPNMLARPCMHACICMLLLSSMK